METRGYVAHVVVRPARWARAGAVVWWCVNSVPAIVRPTRTTCVCCVLVYLPFGGRRGFGLIPFCLAQRLSKEKKPSTRTVGFGGRRWADPTLIWDLTARLGEIPRLLDLSNGAVQPLLCSPHVNKRYSDTVTTFLSFLHFPRQRSRNQPVNQPTNQPTGMKGTLPFKQNGSILENGVRSFRLGFARGGLRSIKAALPNGRNLFPWRTWVCRCLGSGRNPATRRPYMQAPAGLYPVPPAPSHTPFARTNGPGPPFWGSN